MNNLIISYDLYKAGQNYEAVAREIGKLGGALKIHLSVWYVSSPYSAEEAKIKVNSVMDSNDKLFVVNATNDTASWNAANDATQMAVLKKLWESASK